MSFRGVWVLATAGHVLQDLDTLVADPRRRITMSGLVDSWSPGAVGRDPVPFDLAGAPKIYIHDDAEGLDFGFILIRPYYRSLLQANGIVAINEELWQHLHEVPFTHYGILGIPRERVEMQVHRSSFGAQITSTVQPIYIPVTLEENPPPELRNTTCPRFIGRVQEVPDLNSIVGMSGCPIFGFRRVDDFIDYSVVAIQSCWRRSDRIICGSLLPYVGTLVLQELEQTNQTSN
jgi:hypothetical protein